MRGYCSICGGYTNVIKIDNELLCRDCLQEREEEYDTPKDSQD